VGHLGQLKAEYRALVQRLDASFMPFPAPEDERAFAGFREALEILYRPEDAALAARMPHKPARLEELAARLGLPAAELAPRLEELCERGLVMDLIHPKSGEVRFMLSPPLGGFLEFSMMRAQDHIPKKRLAEALEAYLLGDDTFARELFARPTKFGRALADEGGLGDAPEVLDWERASAVIAEASHRAVSLCYCRHLAEHLGPRCDAPLDVCLSLGSGADFVVRRGFGRAIERQEAQAILEASREAGLVQLADNVQRRPVFLCNCCGCCCEQLQAIRRHGLPAVNPSGFQPTSDPAACKGCGRCARSCPIGAIALEPTPGVAKRRQVLAPVVDLERCIGCGVCARACPQHALSLVRRPKQPTVPASAFERVTAMALERGNLGALLFDDAGAGGRFLGKVLDALTRLPAAQRALAQTQVRSRFLGFFLGKKT